MILKHDDIVNMVCGVPGSFEVMSYLEKTGRKEFYSYCDHPYKFKYNRGAIYLLSNDELVELYEGMMAANSKEPPKIAKATITEKQAHNKRAYFLCSNCGKVEISSGDLYCPMCGWELEFPFEK